MAGKYMFRNIHKLIVYVLIPAVLFGIATDMKGFLNNIIFLSQGETISMQGIYGALSLLAKPMWYIVPFAVFFLLIANGSLLPAIDRHMRIGKFSFKFYKYFNETVKIVIPIFVFYIALAELFAFLTACLTVLFGLFVPLSGMSGVAITLFTVMTLLWIIIMSLLTVWIPSCLVQGNRFLDGLSASSRMVGRRFGKFFLALLIPFAIVIALHIVAALYLESFAVIIYIVTFALLLMYLDALCMASYFDINDYERKDIKLSLFARR